MASEILTGTLGEGTAFPAEDEVKRFYEASILLLERWVVGDGSGKDQRERLESAFGREMEEEKEMIFPGGFFDSNAVDYDENDIPGVWVFNGRSKQAFFRPLSKANHLFLAYEDKRAARGLLACVPGLRGLVDKDSLWNLDGNDLLTPLRSASIAALCGLEGMAELYSMTTVNKIALWVVFVPFVGVVWVKEKIEDLTGRISRQIEEWKKLQMRF